MNSIISALSWRYATKAFDPNKKISSEDISTIQEALRLSASSFGLQPWKFVFVENPVLREKLVEHSWGQKQVVDASHLLVFCVPSDFGMNDVIKLTSETANIRNIPKESLDGYEQMMIQAVEAKKEGGVLSSWMEKQTYIALGNIMTVLAQMNIDSCPMEGFISEKIDEILALKEKGLKSVVMLPIGYRDETDKYAHLAKIRYSQDDSFLHLS